MRKEALLLIFVILNLMFIQVVSASLTLKNYSVENSYGPEENIKGWLNISVRNELGDSKIEASNKFSGGVNLKDFLNLNEVDYTCKPEDCENSYKTSNPSTSKSFSLDSEEEKIISFVLNGKISSITSLSFDVSVANQQSCSNPIEIDVLDDSSIEWKSDKQGDNYVCAHNKGRGCFNEESSLIEVYVGNLPFCEKISLLESGKFKLGAWLREDTGSSNPTDTLKMFLYNPKEGQVGSCNLPAPSSSGGLVSCIIDKYVNKKTQEFYVCLKSETKAITRYKIKRENVEPCGFNERAENFDGDFTYDYYIFANSSRYEEIGSFIFNQDEYAKRKSGQLADYISNYVRDRYKNNCTNSCSVPVKFASHLSETVVEISNLVLNYWSGGGITETEIYDAEKEAANLNTDFVILNLSFSNITVPREYGNYTFSLYFDGEEILSKKIEVKKVPLIKRVYPTKVPAAVLTKFKVDVSMPSNKSIINYTWDFGDDTIEETKTDYANHIYSEIGSYELILKVKDEEGFSASRTFTISVESPKEVANSTIKEYKKRLDNLSVQLSLMPKWLKVGDIINITTLKEELENLEREYDSATSDEEYVDIMAGLTELKIPYAIKESGKGSMPFFVDVNVVNVKYFSELGAGAYNKSDEVAYKNAIGAWTQENLDMNLEFEYISAYYDYDIEGLLGVFKLKLMPKEEADKEMYILIQNPEIIFGSQQITKSFDDATGIKFSNIKNRDMEFAILGNIPVESLVLYLSPEFSQLILEKIEPCNFNGRCEPELGENWRNCRADCKPWGLVSVMLLIVFFSALIVYILLQWWYRVRYESYLFKNRNDIYNIVSFVKNARIQGLSENEISSRLKKEGWRGEQVGYVLKRLKGKAIMPFDFLKLFRKFRKT